MITYLLDTNVCIELLRGNHQVRREFLAVQKNRGEILLSSIVAAELWYGVSKSRDRERNTRALEVFFAGPLRWTAFDEIDAQEAGAVRAELEGLGRQIGSYDTLIAGHALRHHATLVTANTKEFSRIDGLMWEDWSGRPARKK